MSTVSRSTPQQSGLCAGLKNSSGGKVPTLGVSWGGNQVEKEKARQNDQTPYDGPSGLRYP